MDLPDSVGPRRKVKPPPAQFNNPGIERSVYNHRLRGQQDLHCHFCRRDHLLSILYVPRYERLDNSECPAAAAAVAAAAAGHGKRVSEWFLVDRKCLI